MKKKENIGMSGRNLVKRSRFTGYKGIARIGREVNSRLREMNERIEKEAKMIVEPNWKAQLLALRPQLEAIPSVAYDFRVKQSTEQTSFFEAIKRALRSGEKIDNRVVNKLAEKYNETNPRKVKELTELALVEIYRKLAHSPNQTIKQRFESIVEFYKKQVNLSLRTSTSVILQQYSTPAPIAYLMGVFTEIDETKANDIFLEPSAGNGLLTIAGKPQNFIINEIDEIRIENLRQEPYKALYQEDSSKNKFFERFEKDNISFDAILSNPPFGALQKYEHESIGKYIFKDLDHLMAAKALNLLKPNGKAAIIIGGHTKYDTEGRIMAGKNRIFINFLYQNYHVTDIINISGDLYSRMGTSFDIRLILISGKKEKIENTFAPLENQAISKEIKTFEQLFNRIFPDAN